MAVKTQVEYLGTRPEYQEISDKDLNLVSRYQATQLFGEPQDYVELYITDLNGNTIISQPDFRGYEYPSEYQDSNSELFSALRFSPDRDAIAFGVTRGIVDVNYYIYRNILGSSINNRFFISEISSDRTELRVKNLNQSVTLTQESFVAYSDSIASEAYYPEFLLNFGSNQTLIGVNLALVLEDDGTASILVKLYEPLSAEFDIKDSFWFVNKLSEPVVYRVTFDVEELQQNDEPFKLRGPNFKIELQEKVNQTTEPLTISALFATGSPVQTTYQQVKSLLEEQSAEINIDYTDFNNFVHFSSITDRIYNFAYKVQLIESYSADLTALDSIVNSGEETIISGSRTLIEGKINSIIEKFDGYEYFLYYENNQYSWPKYYSSTKPYNLYSITSSEARLWLGDPNTEPSPLSGIGILYSASQYDTSNQNLFYNSIPTYLTEDPANAPFEAFLNMTGQHFDTVWTYLKDVTEKNKANNKLTRGISKDLIADTLKSFGISLYTNTNISDSLYYSLLGYNGSGNNSAPTSSEDIDYYITSNETSLPANDITLEYYKRLYHNLPYLLKTKGTERGVRALINCYGIPDTILRVDEYGGTLKTGSLGAYRKNRFSLAYDNSSGTSGGSVASASLVLAPEITYSTYFIQSRPYFTIPLPVQGTNGTFETVTFTPNSSQSTGYLEKTQLPNIGNVYEFGTSGITTVQTFAAELISAIINPTVPTSKYFTASYTVINANRGTLTLYTLQQTSIINGEPFRVTVSTLDSSTVYASTEEVFTNGSNPNVVNIAFPWAPSYYRYLQTGNANLVPDGIEFRFKTKGIPAAEAKYLQPVFQVGEGTGFQFGVGITYDPSISIPGSPYEKYGVIQLVFNDSGATYSDELYLPIFDEEKWWTVLITRANTGLDATGASNTYWIYVKNAFYNEEGVDTVGFQASASMQASTNAWNNFNPSQVNSFDAFLGGTSNNSILSPDNTSFDGYFQEFRYWIERLPEPALDVHVLSSGDYSTTTATGSLHQLVFRAPLGNELNVPYLDASGNEVNAKDYDLYQLGISAIDPDAVVTTIHPAVTGSIFIPEQNAIFQGVNSFLNGGLPYGYGVFSSNNPRSFVAQEFTDIVYVPITGITQRTNNKIFIQNGTTNDLPVGAFLSPEVALINYPTDRVLSSPDVEVAFTPSDSIDEDIINQLGAFNIDDLIGSPQDRYTINYPDLERVKKAYFNKYLRKFNLWDFLRLLKYIDNSLFKMIKDFVPARANLTTGVIIKSHILERPKYQRFEPTITRHDYSASIDTAFIEGTNPEGVDYNTDYTEEIISPLGIINQPHTDRRETFTGEFGGSTIDPVTGNFPQKEVSNVIPIDTANLGYSRESWYYVTTSMDPLLNNVSESKRSVRAYDLDYSTDQILPINYDSIQYSIVQGQLGNPQYANPYTPWARIQDYYYNALSHVKARYLGTKTTSKLFSSYSVGDDSYPGTAAIDKIRFQYSYLVDIYSASITLPSRSNAQIKYLIDDTENVLDLTKLNKNIFDIQNIFKGGEFIDISLFDYNDYYSDRLVNTPVELFEGGFRYLPIFHNIAGTQDPDVLKWIYETPFETQITVPGGANAAACLNLDPAIVDPASYRILIGRGGGTGDGLVWTARIIYDGPPGTMPSGCLVSVEAQLSIEGDYFCGASVDTNWNFIFNGANISNTVQILCPNITDADGRTTVCPECRGTSPTLAVVGITAGPPPGNLWSFYNPGAIAIGQYQGLCDSGSRDYPIPAGNSTACLYSTSTPTVPAGVIAQQIGTCTDCPNDPDTIFKTYVTEAFETEPCLKLAGTPPGSPYGGRLIRFSETVTRAVVGNPDGTLSWPSNIAIRFSGSSDPGAAGTNIEQIVLPFTLGAGDGIHFFTASIGWAEQEEYRVVTTFLSGSEQGIRLFAVLDKPVNRNVMEPPGTTGFDANGLICKFIVVKHLPDETNLILRYNPIKPEFVEQGIVYPQYILKEVRDKAGNVIKSLKSQGLI